MNRGIDPSLYHDLLAEQHLRWQAATGQPREGRFTRAYAETQPYVDAYRHQHRTMPPAMWLLHGGLCLATCGVWAPFMFAHVLILAWLNHRHPTA